MTNHQRVADWQDPTRSADERVDALLNEMTPEEKVAQLGSVWPGAEEVTGNVAPMMDVFARAIDFDDATRHGIGHITRAFGTRPVTAADGCQRLRELQQHLVTSTRLGIPAIVHEECLTGFTTLGATVFPTAIAWAATFDPALIREMATAIGEDMAAVGVHQGLSPVLDVVRDYRWGRVEETLGEDPYLVSQIGSAYVRGLEDAGIVATLKHFAGYSSSRAGRNHAPVSIGPREFADQILPPFEYAIKVGRSRSVMNSYSDVDGVPAAANPWLLTDLLREDWGFDGTVVSDYWSVAFLRSMHRVTNSWGGAGHAALIAGIDVELPDTLCYGQPLLEEMAAGRLDPVYVDRATRRVLNQKLELGLLDANWSPGPSSNDVDLDSERNRFIARRIADRSVVLLDNMANVLPLSRLARMAVVGPCADDPQAFFGCYSFPNHVLPKFPGSGIGIEAASLLSAIRAEFPSSEITHEPGCQVSGGDLTGLDTARLAAENADVTIIVVGDRAGIFGGGTSGEGCDVPDLGLPGHQPTLVETILNAGNTVILVSVSGRPYALGAYTNRATAIIQAFFPGEEGGQAIAGVLSGRINPSGKLPVEIPRHAGGSPHTYLAPPLGQNSEGVSSLDPTAAYPFGHGASYTTFAYGPLTATSNQMPTDGSIDLSVTVTNTGQRDGEEVVQVYFSDSVASVTRPVTQLLGFARVPLAAGDSSQVTFTVHADRLSFTGRDLTRIVEPGLVTFTVGSSAERFTEPVEVTVTGRTRTITGPRVMDTPVHTSPA
jgi:beta-xylosidase